MSIRYEQLVDKILILDLSRRAAASATFLRLVRAERPLAADTPVTFGASTALTEGQQVIVASRSDEAALQPALIIFLAIAVGGITITMLSAVFSMNAVEF